jgi:hypothetical protein
MRISETLDEGAMLMLKVQVEGFGESGVTLLHIWAFNSQKDGNSAVQD